MNIDTIASSTKLEWADNGASSLLVPDSLWFDRAQQPDGLAGFPYGRMFIDMRGPEVVEKQAIWLVTYDVRIETWTAQGFAGTTGDQVTDQGNLMRAFEAMFRAITPNETWRNVVGFLHILKGPSTIRKDPELYLGHDVYVGTANWEILVSE